MKWSLYILKQISFEECTSPDLQKLKHGSHVLDPHVQHARLPLKG